MSRRRTAFTLVEMLIVMVIIGILVAVTLPAALSLRSTQLISAGRMLSADIEFAQCESIAHADDPRFLRFDVALNRYWIAARSAPTTPIADPGGQGPLLVQFGNAQGSALDAVVIQGLELNGDSDLSFDALGRPDQAQPARVTLRSEAATLTVTVAASTGEVSVTPP